MTAPVRTRISTSSGAFSKKNFTVSFFVPFDLQVGDCRNPNSVLLHTTQLGNHSSALTARHLFSKMTSYQLVWFLYGQDHPPKPTSPDVYIEKLPAFTAFVSQFGGFAMDDWTISGKAKALAEVRLQDLLINGNIIWYIGHKVFMDLVCVHCPLFIVVCISTSEHLLSAHCSLWRTLGWSMRRRASFMRSTTLPSA